MRQNKLNRDVKSQIHLYCTPKLYEDFKQVLEQYNKETGDNLTISEALRFFIYQFANSYNMKNSFKIEFKEMLSQFRSNNKRGVSNGEN